VTLLERRGEEIDSLADKVMVQYHNDWFFRYSWPWLWWEERLIMVLNNFIGTHVKIMRERRGEVIVSLTFKVPVWYLYWLILSVLVIKILLVFVVKIMRERRGEVIVSLAFKVLVWYLYWLILKVLVVIILKESDVCKIQVPALVLIDFIGSFDHDFEREESRAIGTPLRYWYWYR
jgi:hypothetical protein